RIVQLAGGVVRQRVYAHRVVVAGRRIAVQGSLTGRIVPVAALVGFECEGAARGVLDAGRVRKERSVAAGGILGATDVQIERAVAAGGVVGARRVGIERVTAAAGVSGAS